MGADHADAVAAGQAQQPSIQPLQGNFIVETVFSYDGLGLLFYDSLQNADYPVLLAYTLVGAALTVLGNLMADIALMVADPRLRVTSPHQ